MENNAFLESRKSFANWAKSYDSEILVPLYFRRIQKTVLNVAGNIDRKRILDIGCGTGNMIQSMNERFPNARLIGVDASDEMLAVAKRKLQKRNNIELLIGDSSRLPFAENSFDYVFSTVSFHHWPEQEKALDRIYQILAPRGKLIIADLCIPVFPGEGTNKVVSAREMRYMFEDSGFGRISQYSATDSGKYGYLSAGLGVAVALSGISFVDPATSAFVGAGVIATGLIAGGIIYACPNWTSRITVGEK